MADDIYSSAFAKYGESPKSLHWVSYPSQAVRLKHIARATDLEGKTILDAGCGMGDLLPFIYAYTNSFHYLGMDINKSFIEVAKKRYVGHDFKAGDPFFGKMKSRFDVVLSSGVMNENIENWPVIRQQMISSLFNLCTETLVFNMAGNKKYMPADGKIAYAVIDDIYSFCKTLARTVSINDSYSHYDFTVVMKR
jgi:SAM-dependent methyltransferase